MKELLEKVGRVFGFEKPAKSELQGVPWQFPQEIRIVIDGRLVACASRNNNGKGMSVDQYNDQGLRIDEDRALYNPDDVDRFCNLYNKRRAKVLITPGFDIRYK